jgi:CheY-like chemotaxis protein
LVIADSMRLRQVLVNLLGNAMKFTRKGEVFLNVTLSSRKGNVLNLNFEITDTGIGIPAEKLSHLFKPFTQLDSSTTRKYGGTGLGLAITKRLVQLLGGDISVESTVGKGTKFNFNIKCEAQNMAQRYSGELQGMEGKRLLIVNDNDTMLQVLKAQLDLWHLLVTPARSAAEAIKFLEGGAVYDLVIADMQMPNMNGIELTRIIKKHCPKVPVILLSSIGDDSRKKYPELFAATLTKPIKQHQLYNIVQTELKQNYHAEAHYNHVAAVLSPDFAENNPLKLLVAEDNLINQKLIIRILNKLGYEPELANNGVEALQLLAEKTFDVILMDIQMPEMDGLETTKRIRKDISIDQPYIVAMTANAMPEDKEDCYNAGMNNYISKPIKLDLLVGVLHEAYKAKGVVAEK